VQTVLPQRKLFTSYVSLYQSSPCILNLYLSELEKISDTWKTKDPFHPPCFFIELRKSQGKQSSKKLILHPQFDHILNLHTSELKKNSRTIFFYSTCILNLHPSKSDKITQYQIALKPQLASLIHSICTKDSPPMKPNTSVQSAPELQSAGTVPERNLNPEVAMQSAPRSSQRCEKLKFQSSEEHHPHTYKCTVKHKWWETVSKVKYKTVELNQEWNEIKPQQVLKSLLSSIARPKYAMQSEMFHELKIVR